MKKIKRTKMLHVRLTEDCEKKLKKLTTELGVNNRSWVINSMILFLDSYDQPREKFLSTLKNIIPYL